MTEGPNSKKFEIFSLTLSKTIVVMLNPVQHLTHQVLFGEILKQS